MIGGSEQVRLECYWQGGNRTSHQLVRPVARVQALSIYPGLVARAGELHLGGPQLRRDRHSLPRWTPSPPDTFNGPTARRTSIRAGQIAAKRGTPRTIPHRRPNEWTINELAAEIGAPPATIYHWVQKGALSSR